MEQLRKRIAKGDTEAFVELYDQLGDRLLRYLTARLGSSDAPDVLQEVFVRLVRYHRKLGRSKNLTAYVFRTARNEANRWQSKKQKRNRLEIPYATVAAPETASHAAAERNELVGLLLDELSPDSREIVQLKIYSGITFAEIAKILTQNESTVATKYRRSLSKMQLKLQAMETHQPMRAK